MKLDTKIISALLFVMTLIYLGYKLNSKLKIAEGFIGNLLGISFGNIITLLIAAIIITVGVMFILDLK